MDLRPGVPNNVAPAERNSHSLSNQIHVVQMLEWFHADAARTSCLKRRLGCSKPLENPFGRLSHVLKKVVDGVQDAVRANFNQHVGQCLCTKIATSSDAKVLPQVLA